MAEVDQYESEARHALLGFAKTVLALLIAFLVYGFGLIAPLTPSVGHASALEYLLFLGVPIFVLFARAQLQQASLSTKLVCAIAALAILASYLILTT